jgi:hypothetical protein
MPDLASRRTVSDADYDRWSSSVEAWVRQHAPDHAQPRLHACLLDRNLETLLMAVGGGMTEPGGVYAKNRLDRDKHLQRAASDERLVRKACAEMPSWEQLVATVTRLVRAGG